MHRHTHVATYTHHRHTHVATYTHHRHTHVATYTHHRHTHVATYTHHRHTHVATYTHHRHVCRLLLKPKTRWDNRRIQQISFALRKSVEVYGLCMYAIEVWPIFPIDGNYKPLIITLLQIFSMQLKSAVSVPFRLLKHGKELMPTKC